MSLLNSTTTVGRLRRGAMRFFFTIDSKGAILYTFFVWKDTLIDI